MKWPPFFLRCRIRGSDRPRIGCWLPLFLLWPVAAALVLILLPLVLLAEIVLRLSGSPMRPLGGLRALCGVVTSLRGLRVDIQERKKNAVIHVSII
jgi:hypothetical protein